MKEPSFLCSQSLRLLMFGGKGGVGKTTCSASTALYLARHNPQKSYLLVSTDPAHSLVDSFAGTVPPDNLRMLELDTQAQLKDFMERNHRKLQEIASRGTFLDEEDIDRFLNLSLPGMDELISFMKISRWVKEKTYDCIIVDTAPTGHTLRLMAMPEMIHQWLDALDALLAKHRYMKKLFQGTYKRDDLDHFIEGLAASVRQMERILEDHNDCRFVPVMLAEALSVQETIMLIDELKRLRIGIEDIVLNRVFPDVSCTLCKEGRTRQMKELANLLGCGSFSPFHLWGIPLYPYEVCGRESLQAFWKNVFGITTSCLVLMEQPPETAVRVDEPSGDPPPETTLLLFAGKGGVGKTTLACATALHLAQVYKEKRILLFSADPAHSLSDCLKLEIGSHPKRIVEGLSAMEIDAGAKFAALKQQYEDELKEFLSSALPNIDLSFDREVMERIMDLSPPGLDEIMALAAVMDFLIAGRYDLLILDAAPTGHLIRLLELPEIIDQWLKVFFGLFLKYKRMFHLPKISQSLVRMSKDLKILRSILHDPERAALYAVSILTEMSFQETTDLLAACGQLSIHVPVMLFNLATPESDCRLCSSIYQREARIHHKFSTTFPGIHQTTVYRQSDPTGIKRLTVLGEALYLTGQMRALHRGREIQGGEGKPMLI